MAKQIKYSDDARNQIFLGIEMVAKAVMVTMGPKGRNVIIEKSYGAPTVTNDGVSIVKEIEFEDKFLNIGANLSKEAASKTNESAGDGTTTATALTYAVSKDGLRYIKSGVNPFSLSRGLHKAVEKVVEELAMKSKTIKSKEEIKQVAALSAQDEEV
jgi:chaperonin GroEL